jgi:hypothetical protein
MTQVMRTPCLPYLKGLGMKRISISIVVSGACGLAMMAAPAQAALPAVHSAAATTAARFAFQGNAYGTRATLGHVVTSGKSAPVVLACSTAPDVHKVNQAAGVSAPPLLGSGTVHTTADTLRSPVEAKTTARVQNLALLSGLISATAVESDSATIHRASGFGTSSAGTTFTGLVVAGVPITGVVDPNTRIDVAGIGYVVLNEQSGKVGARSASLTVNALHLVVTDDNALGIPVGSEVVVAHAFSGLGGPAVATVDGFAYGSRAKAGDVLSSGPSFRVTLPCLGTSGRVKVNEGAGVSIPGVLQTGAIHNTAQGTTNASTASAETTSTVDGANLITGLLQATVIKADAHASTNGDTSTFSDSGSSFATLSVEGFPDIGPGVDPNTKVHIVGLGTLWLHRVIRRPTSIEVRMIELVVRHDNSAGLPIGADIQIAVAHASAH